MRAELQTHVQPEGDFRPGNRIGRVDRPHHPPAGVDLHLLEPGVSVERPLPRVLHAGLADVAGGPVVRIALETAPLVGIDPSHVAHHVGQRLAEGILAHEPGVDVDPREPVPVDREDGDLAFVEAGLERDALEPRKLAHLPPELLLFPLVDGQDFVEERKSAVHSSGLLRDDLEAEHREVAGQHHPVPVPHETAGGRNRVDPDPVLARERRVVFVLDDLKMPGPQKEHEKPRPGEARADDDPRAIPAPLAHRIPAKRVEAHEGVRRAGGARSLIRPGTGGERAGGGRRSTARPPLPRAGRRRAPARPREARACRSPTIRRAD